MAGRAPFREGGRRPLLARALALFLGGYSILNVLGESVRRGFDQNTLWIDLGPVPPCVGRALLFAAASLLVLWGASPGASALRRRATAVAALLLAFAALANAAVWARLATGGVIRSGAPIPLSLLVALALLRVAWVAGRGRARDPRRLFVLASVIATALAFPLAQFLLLGRTDYRRPADLVVVFGARTYSDGRPSLALADRVRTGAALYREGLVRLVVLSGGPGDGDVHETEAMRALAVSLGVPEGAIVLDRRGFSTRETAANLKRICERRKVRSVLAVSHAYHLPRVRMALDREGIPAYSVPAKETRTLRKMPYLMAREVVAFWDYWLRPAS